MQVAESELRFTAEGIQQALTDWSRGVAPVTIEKVEITDGAVRAKVRGEGLLPLPVTVVVSVAEVQPRRLTLNLNVEQLDFLPTALRGAALGLFGRQLQVPGVELSQNRLTVNVSELPIPVRFDLDTVAIEPGQVRVKLSNLTMNPAGDEIGVASPVELLPRPEREVEGEHRKGYQAVRSHILNYLDRKVPNWLQPAVPWLLLLPDFFVLLVRLARHPEVPGRAKVLAAAVLGYIALPFDLLPDVLPGIGLLDDVALSLMALETLLSFTPAASLRRLWPGEEDLLKVVQDGLQWVVRYYPRPLLQRLRNWLQGTAQRQPSGHLDP